MISTPKLWQVVCCADMMGNSKKSTNDNRMISNILSMSRNHSSEEGNWSWRQRYIVEQAQAVLYELLDRFEVAFKGTFIDTDTRHIRTSTDGPLVKSEYPRVWVRHLFKAARQVGRHCNTGGPGIGLAGFSDY